MGSSYNNFWLMILRKGIGLWDMKMCLSWEGKVSFVWSIDLACLARSTMIPQQSAFHYVYGKQPNKLFLNLLSNVVYSRVIVCSKTKTLTFFTSHNMFGFGALPPHALV